MAEKTKKLSMSEIAEVAAALFDEPVKKISAPGGKSRESLRVHLGERTVFATQRSRLGRMRMEIEVLKRLTEQGAPVPRFLGSEKNVFFQGDVGARRLSTALKMAKPDDQLLLAEKTVESLLSIHAAAEKADLAAIVPALGESADWLTGFVSTSTLVSQKYGFEAADLDIPAVVQALMVTNPRFIKWDARPGNGSVGADGRVYWFDWEHCGKRQGMEDFAWLAGDEFWPLGSDELVGVLQKHLPAETAKDDITYLGIYISFHIVQRLRLIFRRFIKVGWVDADKAMQFDKIGTDPDLALRLCKHGAGWADRDALSRPMVKWFESCAAVIWELKNQTEADTS